MSKSRRVVVLRGGAGAGSTSYLEGFRERGYEDVPTSALWYRPAALLGTDTYSKGGIEQDEAPTIQRVEEVYREIVLPQLDRIGITSDNRSATIDGTVIPVGNGIGALRDPRLPRAYEIGAPGIMQHFAGTEEGRNWANGHLVSWVLSMGDRNFAIEGRDEGIPLTDGGVEGLLKFYLDRSYSAASTRLEQENPEMDEGERFAWALLERDMPDILRPHGKMLPEPNAVIVRDFRRLRKARELAVAGRELIIDTTSRRKEEVATFLGRIAA